MDQHYLDTCDLAFFYDLFGCWAEHSKVLSTNMNAEINEQIEQQWNTEKNIYVDAQY